MDQICWIEVRKISPHPDNPRLFIRQELVDSIASQIQQEGFPTRFATTVRPIGDGYEMISGHHRRLAAIKAGCEKIPCWIMEFDDYQAQLELVRSNNQGELSPLEIGIHALKCVPLEKGGKGRTGGLNEYARAIGKAAPTVHNLRDAAKVYLQIVKNKPLDQSNSLLLEKSTHLAAIAKCAESDWQMLTKLLLEKDWSVREIDAAASAVRSTDIPEYLQHWLEPNHWKRSAALSAAEGDERVVRDVANWIKVAQENLESLPESRNVWKFEDGKPYHQTINLKQQFLENLPSIKNPSSQRIKEIASNLLEEVARLDMRYEEWLLSQKSLEQAQRLQEQTQRRRLAIEAQFSPVGFCTDVREWNIEPNFFDAIITDPPYLLSDGGMSVRSGKQQLVDKNFADSPERAIQPEEWVAIAYRTLKPGGYLVVTCTEHLLFDHDLDHLCQEYGFHRRQVLIWDKPNAPPNLSADRFAQSFEFIYVAFKPGATPYFGYDDIQCNGKQARSLITIPQCSGNERLGWHDTQKPLALAELLTKAYVPPRGKVADMFAGTGSFTLIAKRLGRIGYWVEQNPEFFAKAQSRLDDEPLPKWLFE